jgi:TRAP-type C4-dicarboxylate transport system permease small subunit
MLNKSLGILEPILKRVCALFCGILVAVLFYAVILRYVFHAPPAWSMELSRVLFLWMIVLSAFLISLEGGHIQIIYFKNLLPPRLRIIWDSILHILMVLFCAVMVYQGFLILPLVSEAATPTLGISMGWLYLTVPVGGILMGLATIDHLIQSIVKRRNSKPQ